MLVFILLGITSNICASEDPIQDALEIIFQRVPSAIKCVEEEKVYINSGKVFIHEGKIHVLSEDGSTILIPCIFSDESGLYIQTLRKQQTIYICTNPNCATAYYDVKPPECYRCHGTSFIVRYR